MITIVNKLKFHFLDNNKETIKMIYMTQGLIGEKYFIVSYNLMINIAYNLMFNFMVKEGTLNVWNFFDDFTSHLIMAIDKSWSALATWMSCTTTWAWTRMMPRKSGPLALLEASSSTSVPRAPCSWMMWGSPSSLPQRGVQGWCAHRPTFACPAGCTWMPRTGNSCRWKRQGSTPFMQQSWQRPLGWWSPCTMWRWWCLQAALEMFRPWGGSEGQLHRLLTTVMIIRRL